MEIKKLKQRQDRLISYKEYVQKYKKQVQEAGYKIDENGEIDSVTMRTYG